MFVKKVSRPIPCPGCGTVGLEIHNLLVVQPPHAAGGRQTTGEECLFVVCHSCGAKAEGKVVIEKGQPSLDVNMDDMKVPPTTE